MFRLTQINVHLFLHSNCLQYTHLPLLQEDLKTEQIMWNTHDIRKQRNAPGPFGKPDLLYTSPPPGMSFATQVDYLILPTYNGM